MFTYGEVAARSQTIDRLSGNARSETRFRRNFRLIGKTRISRENDVRKPRRFLVTTRGYRTKLFTVYSKHGRIKKRSLRDFRYNRLITFGSVKDKSRAFTRQTSNVRRRRVCIGARAT